MKPSVSSYSFPPLISKGEITQFETVALAAELGDTTLITVAQRVSSVKNCTHIIVLDDGRVIGQGTHEHLLENCREYREISDSQMGGAFVE